MHLEKHCLSAILQNVVKGKQMKWEVKEISGWGFFKDTF